MFKAQKTFKSFYSTNRSYRVFQESIKFTVDLGFPGVFLVNREYREETRRQRGTHCCSHVSHAPHKVITKSPCLFPHHSTTPYPLPISAYSAPSLSPTLHKQPRNPHHSPTLITPSLDLIVFSSITPLHSPHLSSKLNHTFIFYYSHSLDLTISLPHKHSTSTPKAYHHQALLLRTTRLERHHHQSITTRPHHLLSSYTRPCRITRPLLLSSLRHHHLSFVSVSLNLHIRFTRLHRKDTSDSQVHNYSTATAHLFTRATIVYSSSASSTSLDYKLEYTQPLQFTRPQRLHHFPHHSTRFSSPSPSRFLFTNHSIVLTRPQEVFPLQVNQRKHSTASSPNRKKEKKKTNLVHSTGLLCWFVFLVLLELTY